MEKQSLILPIAVTILLSMLVFGGLGYYLGTTMNNLGEAVTYASPAPDIASPSAMASSTATADWKTYTDANTVTRSIFTIKYPSTWAYARSNGTDVTFSKTEGDQWQLQIAVKPIGEETLAQVAAENKSQREKGGYTVTETNTTIDSEPAIKMTLSSKDGTYGDTEYLVVHDTSALTITQGSGVDSTTSAMIETIKFK